MANRTILKFPNQTLRNKSEDVLVFDDDLKNTIQDIKDTLKVSNGVGLAAPQVSIFKKIICIDMSRDEDLFLEEFKDQKELVLINPVITPVSDKTEKEYEGCLSVPSFTYRVERFKEVNVSAKLESGEDINFNAKNMFARVLQHEVDHLDGKLFIDRISKHAKDKYIRKINRSTSFLKKLIGKVNASKSSRTNMGKVSSSKKRKKK